MYHIAILAVPVILLVSALFWFQNYTAQSRQTAFFAYAGSGLCGIMWIMLPLIFPKTLPTTDSLSAIIRPMAGSVVFVFLTAFVLRLLGRWTGGKASAEENQPGLPGVRAWFSAGNVAVGVILVLSLWLGFRFPPLLSAIVIASILAAYPLIRMESMEASPSPVTEDLSSEREKILSMLESGRLTADESSELLQALRQSSSDSPHQTPMTGSRRLMLIGAALVGLGFFMPWIVINPGEEMGRLMGRFDSSMASSFNVRMNFGAEDAYHEDGLRTPNVSIAGGDIPRGLGWAALALALAAAALPYVTTSLDASAERKIRLLSLGIGGFIILYLLTQNPRFIGIGLIMAMVGYLLEGIGYAQERRTAR